MKELIIIKRALERRCDEGLIELIRNGLINKLNEMMDKSIKKVNGEGEMILIREIFEVLIKENKEINKVIIEETNFIKHHII
jgi:hypothetical protein